MNYRMGALVNTVARKIGLRVPQDLSVLAECGLPCARVMCMAAQTVHMASAAVDTVYHRLADPSLPSMK
jgi:DNA-binding LacI/PurR family transcriptional regulator